MFPGLYALKQIIFHHFSEPLMNGNNLVAKTQEIKVLFILQIPGSTQPLIHQDC